LLAFLLVPSFVFALMLAYQSMLATAFSLALAN